MRVAPGLAWRERRGGGAGVVRLARPLLGMRPKHRRQPRSRLRIRHGCDAGGGSGAASSHSGSRFHTRSASLDGAASGRPSAAVTKGAQPQPTCPMRAASPAASRFSATSRPCARRCSNAAASSGSSAASASSPPCGGSKSSASARPRGVGAAGARRQHEREQLQQIECRHATQTEPAERRRPMHQQWRRQAAQMGRGSRRRQQQQFAIGSEDRRAAVAGDDGRCVGQSDPRHGHRQMRSPTCP